MGPRGFRVTTKSYHDYYCYDITIIVIVIIIITIIIIRSISSMDLEGFGASVWDEGSSLKFGVEALEFLRVWVSRFSGSGLCPGLSFGV